MCRVTTREATHHYICITLWPFPVTQAFFDPDMNLYVWGAAEQAMPGLVTGAVPSQKELSAEFDSWGWLHAGCIVHRAEC